jgi:copper ion binding protein
MSHETILNVDGMTCGNCVKHVGEALRKLDGVTAVEVDLSSGRVRVEHDPARVPVPRMIAALDDAGYDARA